MDSFEHRARIGWNNSRLHLGAFALVLIALVVLSGLKRPGVAEKSAGKPAPVSHEISPVPVDNAKSKQEEQKQSRLNDGHNEPGPPATESFRKFEDIAEPPSAVRARSIIEGSTGRDPSDQTVGQRRPVPMNTTRSRSAARSIALADMQGRLPAGYFERGNNRAEVSVRGQDPVTPGAGEAESNGGKENKAGRIFELHELPDSIQGSLPNLFLSILVYSGQAGGRRVVVNGSSMHEGQELTAALKLVEITPDGAIFAYRGYRFHKAVRGD